jgi:hypothetical protein
MDKITLKSLVEGRRSLKESIVEPSEQLLKGVMALFKQTTGLNPAFPSIKSRNKRYDTITYSSSLNKEIRTSLTKLLFSNIDLNVEVEEVPNSIGGYEFKFSLKYQHPDGSPEVYYVGSIEFKNNKLIPKFV